MSDNKIAHLQDLLIRLEDKSLRPGEKLPKGVSFSSELTVAKFARDEINQLNDIQYIDAFQELLKSEKITINKINLINYLVRLANKFERHDIADYVLCLVKKEKTRWVNDVSLRSLNNSILKVKTEQEILFKLATHKDWQIRFNALGLLSKLDVSFHQRIENLCLKEIEKYKSKHHSLAVLSSALSKVGSIKSIEKLKDIIRQSKKSDTVLSALNAIYKISGDKELAFYIETYETKRDSFVKKNLIKVISISGNKDQTLLMIKRLKSILSRTRKRNVYYSNGTEPEIVTILKFLEQKNPKEYKKLIDWLVKKKMDKLDETETKWINQRL